MKRDNINYVLVGTVVAGAFALLIVALVMITGRSGASSSYIVHYRNVTGLRYGAPVFYEGYRIGQVSAIDPERGVPAPKSDVGKTDLAKPDPVKPDLAKTDLAKADPVKPDPVKPDPIKPEVAKSGGKHPADNSGTRYKVTLAVRNDWPIPKDSIAHMTSSGLLADIAIGISEGTSPDAAAPGTELAGMENADLFASMNELAQQLSELTHDQIAPLIKNLAQHVDSIASVLDKNTPELVEQSRMLLQRLNTASDSVNDLLKPQNRAAIGTILANVRDLSHDLRATQDQLNKAIVRIDSVIRENQPGIRDSVDDLRGIMAALSGRIDSISQHLEVAARNFDEFAREVRMNPNRLLIAPKRDKVEEEPK